MKGLLIAEKPSVMRAIRDVYSHEKAGTFPELEFAAFHGHLMALKQPEEYNPAWANRKDNSILPMIPEIFEYKPEDTESVDKLMALINKGGFDYLVNACDAGREGEHIFWSFYECMGLKLPVKRFWATSVTKPALKKALLDLKDAKLYDGMRQAAKFRAQFDWLVGMNLTRAVSNGLRWLGSVGRVQSPTLKIMVDRELEIQNFKPETFYEAKGKFEVNGAVIDASCLIPPTYKETRTDQTTADAIAADVKKVKTGEVKEFKETVKSVSAPTLYSLTELQKDANKYLKFKADHTLAIAQKLYEGGYITYPRTESRFLPTDMVPEIPAHIKPLLSISELSGVASKIGQKEIAEMLKGNYVNDAGITDHHAIIPTDQTINPASLSKDELALYVLVAKSFLAIFLPPYKFASSTMLFKIGNHRFKATGKREVDPGYSILYPKNGDKTQDLPKAKKGDRVTLQKMGVTKGSTKPPQRYSPRTILSAMLNAGQDLPDSAMRATLKEAAGLGTPATRADILQKLEEREYIQLKDNQYYATDKGIRLIKAIGDRTFCSPALTAQWEEKLVALEKGTFTGNFRDEMIDYVKTECEYLIQNIKQSELEVVGTCPICGGKILNYANAWLCERHKKDTDDCPFFIPKKVSLAILSKEDLDTLLAGKETQPFVIKLKTGEKKKVAFFLDENKAMKIKNPKVSVGKCPVCGADLIETDRAWFCSKHSKDPSSCKFSMGKTICGVKVSEEDLKALLAGKKTKPHKFTWKSGRQSDAMMYLVNGDLKFEFPQR